MGSYEFFSCLGMLNWRPNLSVLFSFPLDVYACMAAYVCVCVCICVCVRIQNLHYQRKRKERICQRRSAKRCKD